MPDERKNRRQKITISKKKKTDVNEASKKKVKII